MLIKERTGILAVVCVIAAWSTAEAGAIRTTSKSNSSAIQQTSLSEPNELPQTEGVWPCIGKGYVPYSYPAFGTCPCGENSCYDPARYYCGRKSYRMQWFRKWVRAHLGHGSMLDDVPCGCRFPGSVRPYYRTIRPVKSSVDGVPTNRPAPKDK